MAKEEIKKLVEDSKKSVDKEYENFSNSVKQDLASFKKKSLDRM